MAFYRKSGGSNVTPTIVRRRSGSSWVNVQTIKRRSGGSWVTVWTAYTAVTVTLSTSQISKYGFGTNASGPSGSTNPVVATGHSGTGSYTYSWTRISGDANTNISSTTASSVTFSRTGCASDVDYVSVWRCTISDGTSSAHADVTVTVGYVRLV